MARARKPVPRGEPAPDMVPQRLPFGADFQKSLVRLICEDPEYARVIVDHLEPQYFESEVLAWTMAFVKRYSEDYGAMPSLAVVQNQCATLDGRIRPMYEAMVDQIRQAPLRDVQWMKDQTLDFAKRSIFVRTYQETRNLYNSGKVTEAYDLMMQRMEQVQKTTWEPPDESDFFGQLGDRQAQRMDIDPAKLSIGTGIHSLDNVLSGGLSIGEMGIWVAYPKCGKSTMLINHGVAATRLEFRRTAHFVFEGSRGQVENRYDAHFMDEWYGNVKAGQVDSDKYARAWAEFQALKGLLRIRGFTDKWDYSVVDIWDALRSWKQQGWVPEVLIVDYGDLISGRERTYPNEREKQKAAFRDMKALANRGFCLWTASQAQRPDKGADQREHLIYARDIADCYEKVRVADFIGSINLTAEEKKGQWDANARQWITLPRARLFAELYRDNEAGETIPVIAEYGKMRIYDAKAVGLGYGNPHQLIQAGQQRAF